MKALVHLLSSVILAGLGKLGVLGTASGAQSDSDIVLTISVIGALMLFLAGIRSAAAGPLRRALETHDNLSILAFYGASSGVMAALAGGLVYDELGDWGMERQALFALVLAVHCWGMRTLGVRSADLRGYSSVSKKDTDDVQLSQHSARRHESRSTEVASSFPTSSPGGLASSGGAVTSGAGKPPDSPLFVLNEPKVLRTVDDDADIEDQLFAHALAPHRLRQLPVVGASQGADQSWASFDDTTWPAGPAFPVTAASQKPSTLNLPAPQFDADFEELMRRFDEDDKKGPTGPSSKSAVLFTEPPPEISIRVAEPPAVITSLDASSLLDVDHGGQEDEDELLSCIADIDGP